MHNQFELEVSFLGRMGRMGKLGRLGGVENKESCDENRRILCPVSALIP